MRGTLFFVHGTGVRWQGWTTTWGRVHDYARIAGIDDGVDFVGCAWGPELGVPLDLLPATLPPEPATRDATGAVPPTDREVAAAAWALLLDDPLFELRLAAQGEPARVDVVVAGQLADQDAVVIVRGLAGRRDAALDLAGTDLTPEEIARAAERVAVTPELAGAARAAGSAVDPDLVEAIARAIVAAVLAEHRADPPGTAPAALLDMARRAAAEHRQGLMGSSTPAVGDILFYQRRGEEIARYVAAGLEGLKRPVVAVGHSLGGIILVDLLSRAEHPPVDLLVTAGSQSPMFYAIDALEGIRRGRAAPAPFTPWLNIYNRQDFLSFCATRVFPGVAGIRDEAVDPGVAFPESHSAYWTCDRVYELIRDAWPTT